MTSAKTQPAEATSASGPQPISTQKRVKVPTILQQAAVECGAASLGMVLAHFGRWVSLEQLRSDCGVSRDGSSAVAIVGAAEKYGLQWDAIRGPVQVLQDRPTPMIIWWERRHFMVLEGAKDGRFHLNDPARGRYVLEQDDFTEGFSGVAISLSKGKGFQSAGHKYRAAPALWSRLRSSKPGVITMIIAGLLAMLLGLVIAPISQIFINDVLGTGDRNPIPDLVAALLVIGVFRGGLTVLEYGVIARLQAKVTLTGSYSFSQRLMRRPMMFYLERTVGDLAQRVDYNAQVAQVLANQMASAGVALLGALGYAVLLLYYNVWIGLVVLALTGVNVVVLRLVTDRRTMLQGRVIKRQNDLRGATSATIQGIETVKASGMESESYETLTGYQADYVSAQAELVPTSVLISALPTWIASLTSAAILTMGGYFVITGDFTLGGLLAVQALAINLSRPVSTLMATGGQVQVVTASLEALDDVLAADVEERFDRPELLPDADLPDLAGRLEFRNVVFGYNKTTDPLLTDFSFTLAPGSRIALVGVSGAGKSTVANLAAGLFEPWSGQILFDGTPLQEMPEGVLERTLAKVDQTIVLFEGTVRQNVTLWDTTVPDDQVRQALADAQILPDVLARSGGLDAVVKENGANFSGGQNQRLEIARALAMNPRLLILDEATSALDDITEKLVDDALRRRGVTCLIVAHRLSTIRDADEIVVLGRGGTVLERGTHDDLMAADGTYAQMVSDAGEGGDVGS